MLRRLKKHCARFVALAMFGAIGGCSDSGLPIVPVNGKITFAGGQCPAAGSISFIPVEVEPGLPRRPGSATFLQDGAFAVTSFQEGDGLLPGKYSVSITCLSGMPDPRKPDPWDAVSYVPKDFKIADVQVARDSDPIELAFDVPPKQNKK